MSWKESAIYAFAACCVIVTALILYTEPSLPETWYTWTLLSVMFLLLILLGTVFPVRWIRLSKESDKAVAMFLMGTCLLVLILFILRRDTVEITDARSIVIEAWTIAMLMLGIVELPKIILKVFLPLDTLEPIAKKQLLLTARTERGCGTWYMTGNIILGLSVLAYIVGLILKDADANAMLIVGTVTSLVLLITGSVIQTRNAVRKLVEINQSCAQAQSSKIILDFNQLADKVKSERS